MKRKQRLHSNNGISTLWRRILRSFVLAVFICTTGLGDSTYNDTLWAQSDGPADGVLEGVNCPPQIQRTQVSQRFDGPSVLFALKAQSAVRRAFFDSPEGLESFINDSIPDCLLLEEPTIEEPVDWPLSEPGIFCYNIVQLWRADANPIPTTERDKGKVIHLMRGDHYIFGEIEDSPLGDIYGFQEIARTNEIVIVEQLELSTSGTSKRVEVTDWEKTTTYGTLFVDDETRTDSMEIDLPRGDQLEVEVTVTVTRTMSGGTRVVSDTIRGRDILRPYDVSQMYIIDERAGEAKLEEANCYDFVEPLISEEAVIPAEPGVRIVSGNSPIPGIVASRSGERTVFGGKKGEVVRITMHSDEIDSMLTLMSGQWRIIGSNDDYGSNLDARVVAILEEDGPYSIIAQSYNSGENLDAGRYRLTIEKLGQVPADEVGRTSLLNLGATKYGEITDSMGDRFIFYAEEGEKVNVHLFDEGGLKPVLKLYSPDNKLISIDRNGCCLSGIRYSSIQISHIPVTGSYSIVVQGSDSSTGQYSLGLDSVPTIAYFRPHSIEYGDTLSGEITTNSGEQWIFDGRAGDNIQIFMVATSSIDTALMLISPTGEILTSNDDQRNCVSSYCGRERTDSYIEYSLPISGTYIIYADAFWNDSVPSSRTGTYDISLRQQ